MSKSKIGLVLFCMAMVVSSASARFIVNAHDSVGIVDPARPPEVSCANTEVGYKTMTTDDKNSSS